MGGGGRAKIILENYYDNGGGVNFYFFRHSFRWYCGGSGKGHDSRTDALSHCRTLFVWETHFFVQPSQRRLFIRRNILQPLDGRLLRQSRTIFANSRRIRVVTRPLPLTHLPLFQQPAISFSRFCLYRFSIICRSIVLFCRRRSCDKLERRKKRIFLKLLFHALMGGLALSIFVFFELACDVETQN